MPLVTSRSKIQEATVENWVGRNRTKKSTRARRSWSIAGWPGKLLSSSTPDCPARGGGWGRARRSLGWLWRGRRAELVAGFGEVQWKVCSVLCVLWTLPAFAMHGFETMRLAELAWPLCQCQPVVARLVSTGRCGEHLPRSWEGRTKSARCCCYFWGSGTKQTTTKQSVW